MSLQIKSATSYVVAICTCIILGSGIPIALADFDSVQEEEYYEVVEKVSKTLYTTWLKGGLFSEITQKTYTEITINDTSQPMAFEWGTTIPDAEEGLWRLMSVDPVIPGEKQTYTQLATGYAGDAPMRRFSIELRPYLPPTPPLITSTYVVQVIARTSAYIDYTSQTGPNQGGVKIPAQELGLWSNQVIIYYSTAPEPTTFTITDVYRKATLVLDRIEVIVDQSGSGREEYFLAGFIQELFENCDDDTGQNCKFTTPGKQASFAPDLNLIDLGETCEEILVRPYFRCMSPPTVSSFGLSSYYYEQDRWNFRLNSQKEQWPRRYTVGLSLMEQDAGAQMQDWIDGIELVGDEISTGNIFNLDALPLEDIEQYIADHGISDSQIIDLLAEAIDLFGDIGNATLVGVGVGIVADFVVAAFEDMVDDYYGSQYASLTLQSNKVSYIQSHPGSIDGVGKYEKYVYSSETRRFYGPPLANAAAAFDGIVDITFHWEFSEKEME